MFKDLAHIWHSLRSRGASDFRRTSSPTLYYDFAVAAPRVLGLLGGFRLVHFAFGPPLLVHLGAETACNKRSLTHCTPDKSAQNLLGPPFGPRFGPLSGAVSCREKCISDRSGPKGSLNCILMGAYVLHKVPPYRIQMPPDFGPFGPLAYLALALRRTDLRSGGTPPRVRPLGGPLASS